MQHLLIMMAKQPIPNQTKTRLLSALSPTQAAELYDCFLRDKCHVMRQVPNTTCAIAYTPADARSYFETLAPDFVLYLQEGKDLAERLNNVVQRGFQEGYQKVMPIDGDSVTLPAEYLSQAFEVLDSEDVDIALGPCDDGGYYGIALKEAHAVVFDVQMSTPTVSRDTLRQAKSQNLKVHVLPKWYDVDTPEDLDRLRQELEQGASLAPRTAAYLKGL